MTLLASVLSGCLDEPAASTTKPPAARSTATPKPSAARPTATPKPAPASGQADWTVLVYLDGDNDLEQSAIDDYAEMASVGSNARLNIIVQFDRIASDEDWDDTSNGDWRGVKRFRVERGKKPAKSNQLADLGELNMGDPRTLVDFTTWGIKSYPADHYALIFWDHGASWPGVANDDSSDSDMLTLPELSGALAEVRKRTGVQKLDLIGFDACLMGQIDVLQSVAPYGHVAIGSADLEPGEGWAWNAWLDDVAKKPPQDAAALAPSIIKSFTTFYKEEDDPSVTLAAFDLNKVEQMTSQLDALAGAMIGAMPKSYKAIGKARSYAAEYAAGDTDISAIDLGHFADSLVAASTDKQVAAAARALSQTIKAARIAQGHGADHPKTSGISVYFPRKKKHYDSSYLKSSPLTKATRWDEFLQAFYGGGKTTPSRSAVSQPTLNSLIARPDAPINLQATISGDDTAYVYYFVGQAAAADPNTVQILSMDYLYPPGAAQNDAAPSWHDGDDVQLTWRSSSWYLSNGTDVILTPFAPVDYGSSTYSVDGIYTTRKTGKRIPVSIEFDVTQDRGTLQHVWAFDKGGGENPRPRELHPRAGDTFTPDILTYTDSADDAMERTIAGQPITFGRDPLTAFEGPAPTGD
ncbi:MAG TPA: clostripain-related cysteine peptidase, partial [Roseiflexaceae bacterium]|nr:clostripain-related cysteine peptidase [Roseiflexaceae bacterium]